jgi:hypothetical protein
VYDSVYDLVYDLLSNVSSKLIFDILLKCVDRPLLWVSTCCQNEVQPSKNRAKRSVSGFLDKQELNSSETSCDN